MYCWVESKINKTTFMEAIKIPHFRRIFMYEYTLIAYTYGILIDDFLLNDKLESTLCYLKASPV